jgi:glycoside/pentoside/hexuronide:cation symporter, GPH family
VPNRNPQIASNIPGRRLSWLEASAYAVGDAGFNLYWATVDSFLLFFYTDVVQLAPAQVAFALLFGRIIDLVAGPLIGIGVDRTRTRLGRYRPYLVFLAPPLAVSAVLLFSKPSIWPLGIAHLIGLRDHFALAATVASCIFALSYSMANVPYTALLTVVTSDEAERTRFASLRFAFAAAAGLFVQYNTLALVARFGAGSAALGWQRTLLLYSVPATAALLVCGMCTRERVKRSSEDIKASFVLMKLMRNRTWWWCIIAMLSSIAAFSCRAAASPFYLKYFVLRVDAGGIFLTVNSAAALFACLLVSAKPSIAHSKTSLGVACALMGAIVTCTFLFLPPDRWLMQLAIQVAFGFTTGALVPAIFSIFSDLPQSVPAFEGISIVGIIAASSLLAIKLGAMIGVGLVSVALSLVHYQAYAASSSAILSAIRLLMSVAPALLLFVCCVALLAVERSLRLSASETPDASLGNSFY